MQKLTTLNKNNNIWKQIMLLQHVFYVFLKLVDKYISKLYKYIYKTT